MKQHKYFFPPARDTDDARIAKVDLFFRHDPNYYYLANSGRRA